MNVPETLFKIIEVDGCPLYEQGDALHLSGRALTLPPDRATCMVLMNDIREAVKMCENPDGSYDLDWPVSRLKCSGPETGCVGNLRMEYRVGQVPAGRIKKEKIQSAKEEKIQSIISALSQFTIFKGLNEQQLKDLGRLLKFRQAQPGEIIIKKGDFGVNLYIMASGRVKVFEDDFYIATLKKGDVFGEMSLISGEPVGASVKVVEPSRILYIKGKNFNKVLDQYPSMQMYFARLLTQRLAATNKARHQELASGMAGKLSEIPPAEICQALNINQKTGAVKLEELSNGAARVCFSHGELVQAEYNHLKGVEAFFSILKETEGRFTFALELRDDEKNAPPLGDFMWLLMEGVRRMDEENGLS